MNSVDDHEKGFPRGKHAGSKPNNKQSGNDFTERGSGRWAGWMCSVLETSLRTTAVFGYRGEIRQ